MRSDLVDRRGRQSSGDASATPQKDRPAASAPAGQVRRLGLASVPRPVARAREFTRRALADWCAPESLPQAEQDAVLLVAELVANAVAHAGGVQELALRLRAGVLRVEVSDGSEVLPAPRVARTTDGPGGHGLFIVQRTSLNWGTRTHDLGKTVWAEVDLGAGSEG